MKIYNYSDLPIEIGGVPNFHHIIHLDNEINPWQVKHNGQNFLPLVNEDRNIIYTITKQTWGGYNIAKDEFAPPNIFPWVGMFILFFGFFLMVKIAQKFRTR